MSAPVVHPRQLQVLRLVAEGLTNRQAASELGVAEGTVRNHLYRASLTLGAKHRAHAVLLAMQQGLLP